MSVLSEFEELLTQRHDLAVKRIGEIGGEYLIPDPYGDYFRRMALFITEGGYEDLMPDKYETSYTNPVYAVSRFGTEMGRMLSFLAYELTSLIPLKAEGDIRLEDVTILCELFLEIYTAFQAAWIIEEDGDGARDKDGRGDDVARDKDRSGGIVGADCNRPIPEDLVSDVHSILRSFIVDYTEVTVAGRIRDMVDPSRDFAKRIIMESDLSDISYLERFGEYVTDDTRKLAAFINSLPQEDIQDMADTFTGGFVKGFAATGKDISKKKTVNIRYNLGFERVVRAAILNFQNIGMDVTIYRKALHAATRAGMSRVGYYGDLVNEQMDYDHREDQALFMDKAYAERKLEVVRAAFEEFKEEASLFAGPAVMERFGMKDFDPVNHSESYSMSDKQREISTDLVSRNARIQNEYIRMEERSFTIISYPVPPINHFEEVFRETVNINTLPYEKYRDMQQCIIKELEKGEYVEILGHNGNSTNLRVSLCKIVDINKQSIFENCVADVNIPVGEVFTSPVLAGTNGVLNVSQVYLGGLIYKDLTLTFKDGYITDYSCSNFPTAEENRRYIEENILHHHKSLPMGEFAIGTNTLAYVMAKRYGIFDKLPILIAEKTGPHFAVGDTCYSREEDVKTYNPDGRELIAKENEHTREFRKDDPLKAYYNCHTDITIPYEELKEISSVDSAGIRHTIISGGRFTVEGAEDLNKPLDEFESDTGSMR